MSVRMAKKHIDPLVRLLTIRSRIFSPALSSYYRQASTLQSRSVKVNNATIDFENAKPFTEMPAALIPAFLKPVMPFFMMANRHKTHSMIMGMFDKYGDPVRTKIGNFDCVNTKNPDLFEAALRQEGDFPERFLIDLWTPEEYTTGLNTHDPEKWRRLRTVLNNEIMRPQTVMEYTDRIQAVAVDLVNKLEKMRETDGNSLTVPGIEDVISYWSLESVCTVLYDQRLGILSDKVDTEVAAFVSSIRDFFDTTAILLHAPPKLAKWTIPNKLARYKKATKIMFEYGHKTIDKKIKEIEQTIANGGKVTPGFLPTLLASKEISLAEMYATTSELMIAGVDTTSNSMLFLLHTLSKHPQVQERLFQEIKEVFSEGESVTKEHLQKMQYLKAILRENLRLYPVAVANSRMFTKDTVVAGYQVPKGTYLIHVTFASGRDPKYFQDPLEFRPERWLGESRKSIPPYASLPFGHGPRMCIGRRLVELEMQLLTIEICRRFILKPNSDKELEISTRMLLVPKDPLDLQFINRS